jgi:hypothetical protein
MANIKVDSAVSQDDLEIPVLHVQLDDLVGI